MVAPPSIPRPLERIIDANGYASPLWYAWLASLQAGTADLTALNERVTVLELEVDALQAATGFNIIGQQSVQVLGTPGGGLVSLLLDGDEIDPAALSYYGTDASGSKGWSALALAALSDVDLTGIADGDTLVWNASAEAWEPGAVAVTQTFNRITADGDIRVTDDGDLRITD